MFIIKINQTERINNIYIYMLRGNMHKKIQLKAIEFNN